MPSDITVSPRKAVPRIVTCWASTSGGINRTTKSITSLLMLLHALATSLITHRTIPPGSESEATKILGVETAQMLLEFLGSYLLVLGTKLDVLNHGWCIGSAFVFGDLNRCDFEE